MSDDNSDREDPDIVPTSTVLELADSIGGETMDKARRTIRRTAAEMGMTEHEFMKLVIGRLRLKGISLRGSHH